MQIEEISGAES